MKDKILRAPEQGSLAYQDTAVPRKVMDLLGDTLCCVVHDKNDLDKDDMVNAVGAGARRRKRSPKRGADRPAHLHAPRAAQGRQGADRRAARRRRNRQLIFSAFALDGKTVIDKQVLAVGGKTKVSVK